MRYFKHMSDMAQDVKVKRLIRKFGVEGYGLYCYILELIVRKLDSDHPMPDLEESSHDIATDLSMDTVRVEEIMWFAIEQGLFEQDEISGRVCANKIYKFLQQSETRSEYIRKMIAAYKGKKEGEECLRLSETSMKNRIDKNRIEEKREEDTKERHPKTGAPMNRTTYDSLVTDYGKVLVDDYFERIADYCETKKGRLTYYKDHAHACRNWLKRDKVLKLSKPAEKSEFEEGLSAMIRERYYDKPKA